MDKLTELAIKYGADKWGKHHYTPVYFDLFKDKKVKKVLEIGVAEGASLYMWREFFPEAMIFGAEIDPRRIFKDKFIQCFECDQSKREDLEKLYEQIGSDVDLVIDDGSHKPEDQVLTCLRMMAMLNLGTTYVIEDVSAPVIMQHLQRYDCQMLELGERYDDRLIIVKHKT